MSMDRAAFEAALLVDPDDEAPHKIFADWLDENGFEDEANYHRRWTVELREAEQWMAKFAEGHSKGYWEWDDGDVDMGEKYTAEELIGYATNYVEGNRKTKYGWWGHTQQGDDSLRSDMFEDETREKFWRCWELITGKSLIGNEKDNSPFGCSC